LLLGSKNEFIIGDGECQVNSAKKGDKEGYAIIGYLASINEEIRKKENLWMKKN
jgi:hypothetical protein